MPAIYLRTIEGAAAVALGCALLRIFHVRLCSLMGAFSSEGGDRLAPKRVKTGGCAPMQSERLQGPVLSLPSTLRSAPRMSVSTTRIALFIDGANLYASSRTLGFD